MMFKTIRKVTSHQLPQPESMKKSQHLVKNVAQAHRQKRKYNDQNGSASYLCSCY